MASKTTIRIGNARVDFATLAIEGPAGRTSVEPKVMNLLQVLVNNAGEVVSRTALLDQVWGERYGGDESLSRAVSLLRRAFGQVRGGEQYIETVPKRGYRLVADIAPDKVENTAAPKIDAAQAAVAEPEASAEAPIGPFWLRSPFSNPRRLVVLAVLFIIATVLYLLDNGEQEVLRGETASNLANVIEPVAMTGAPKSIAVLPFEDLSNEGDQQYLSDGLAEEILNSLVRFPDLRVMGRTSSFTFRDSDLNMGEINATLAVSHVLTGSLRKQGNRVRITARLVQARDGYNVWSDSFDGDLGDIFDLQEEIAREIARNLGVVLDLSAHERFVPKLTDSREAYELFLQGRALSRKFGRRNKAKSIELLQNAVSLDPEFAAAWAWLGQAHLYLSLTASGAQIPELVNAAREAVDRSLELDPYLAMGHYVRTVLLDYDLDFSGSMDAVEKAFELNPYQPFLEIRRGNYYGIIGQSRKGVELMEQGLIWDPTDSVGLLNLAVAQQALGRLDRATVSMGRSDDLGFLPAAGQLCTLLEHRKFAEEAKRCWEQLPPDFRHRYRPLFQESQQWARLGVAVFLQDPVAQREVAAELDRHFSDPDSRANSYLLQVYLAVGGPERFMQTFVTRPYPLNSGAISTIWDDREVHRELRQHEKFPAFVERIGLLRAWQKYGWPDRCQPFKGTDGSSGQFSCE